MARRSSRWLLGAAKGYAPKLVNPGGVEVWKSHRGRNVTELDEQVDHFDVTPRQIIGGVTEAVDELGLPHPGAHPLQQPRACRQLATTLETMKALEGHRGHITHIQFHSYGGGEGDENRRRKAVALAEYVNAHPNITVDVGQVMFGETTSMTADGPLGLPVAHLGGTSGSAPTPKWNPAAASRPFKYQNKVSTHALQWAIGLEWYLLVEDPWRMVMSTDHPNGGSFLATRRSSAC